MLASGIGNSAGGTGTYAEAVSSGAQNFAAYCEVLFKLHNSDNTLDVNYGSLVVFGD